MTEDVDIKGNLEGEYDDHDVMTPDFHLVNVSDNGRPCRKLFVQTFFQRSDRSTRSGSPPLQQWHLLAVIFPDSIVMQPVYMNPHAQRYLDPRHGFISTLVY